MENDKDVSATIKETLTENSNTKRHSNKSSESEQESDARLDCNLSLDGLQNNSDMIKYIKQLQKYIKKQERKIKKLKSRLKRYKSRKKGGKTTSSSTQTDGTKEDDSNKPKSLVDEIKEAAENAVAQTGFVYEATSGMYYDYSTGYYYNAELGLYYDGNKGMYLVYNQETKSYDFHSQVETQSVDTHKRKKQHLEKESKRKRNKKPNSDTSDNEGSLEEGECFTSDDDCSHKSSSCSTCSRDENCSDLSKTWPPCMRIIVKETDLENLKIGTLFIVTCDGGTIGREGDHTIILPDINVSKSHGKISFDKEGDKYTIVDLGSRNGTLLNGKRISVSKQESDPQEVVHGSTVQMGSTKLLCHIHRGQQTCGHCEPGLVQANVVPVPIEIEVVKKLPSKGSQHKKELRRLKKRFGLEAQGNENSVLAVGYTDRARVRRKEIGSQNPNEKTQTASIDESISSDNKGFKLLSKMGWNKGESLGKNGSGLLEPVQVKSNANKLGLGVREELSVAVDPSAERKAKIWKKAQDRFQQVQDAPDPDLTLDALSMDV